MTCKEISQQEIRRILFSHKDVQLIDVRDISEYREGHIEGSKLIPLSILPEQLDQLDRNRPVVLICRSGNRSSQACELLSNHGFQASSLHGGLSALTTTA